MDPVTATGRTSYEHEVDHLQAKEREDCNRLSLTAFGSTNPSDALTADFRASRTGDNRCLRFKQPGL